MAKAKQSTYVAEELDWLESKAAEIKKFADANPYDKIKDRKVSLAGAMGISEKVSATIEVQQKSIRESLKDYALILDSINKLRVLDEEKNKKVRGNEDLTPMESGDLDD